jgi:hypothetical protein
MMRIMIHMIVGIMLFQSSFAQEVGKSVAVFSKKLDRNCFLAFEKYNPTVKLFANPFLRIKNKKIKIKNFDANSYSDTNVSLSPNKRFLVMDYITKGYVYQSSTDSSFVENYHCVIVDMRKAKIVKHLQSECDGKWNAQNHWVSDDKIVF